MKKLLLLFLLAIVPFYIYSQNIVKIKPAKSSDDRKWGYQDLEGNWIVKPQFGKAYDFNDSEIAEVWISYMTYSGPLPFLVMNGASYREEMGLIDINGDILVKYYKDQQKKKSKKYEKALKMVATRKATGAYDAVYARLAQVDADILVQKQKKQARQDSILMAQRLLKMRADSIATAKRVADSIAVVEKRQADSIALMQRQNDSINRVKAGISHKKIKITGNGLLVRKDEDRRLYSITQDEYDRYHITYDGTMGIHNTLDVKKVIYNSDLWLLSDSLFHSINIDKLSLEISRNRIMQRYGAFVFTVTLNLNDLDLTFTDEKTARIVLMSISQVEEYVASFWKHYQSSAHLIEPLFQVKIGGKEGITVEIVDKQDNGGSLEDVKRVCIETRRKFATQK